MVFYITYGISLILLSYYLYKNGKRIELFNIFLMLFFVFFGPAFFIFNSTIDDVSTTEALCLTLTVISLLGGSILCNSVIYKPRQENVLISSNQTVESFINPNALLLLFALTFLLFYLALFQYGGINNMLIVLSSGGDLTPDDLKGLRFDFKVDGWVGSIIGYFETIGILISMLMFSYTIQKRRKLLLFLNVIFCFLIILWGASTLHKAIAFFYIIQLLLFFYLLNNMDWMWNTKIVLISSIVVFVLIIPIYMLLTSDDNLGDAATAALERITAEPNRVLREYFIWWPDHFPHKHGLNIRPIHAILGNGEFEPAYKTVVYQYVPSDELNMLVGTWPAIFIADAWVDFSYFGVFLFSIIVGFTLRFIDVFLKYYKNSYGAALFAALVGSLFTLIENALLTAFLTGGLIILPVLFKILVKNKESKAIAD
ncbi:O-antigen polymerase [Emticicia sp. SJ17W-69]|uniref:O-antigen polymerase n=1 Tax=Emticicia sp. SJ17W-69 TaxID=3421657 RepID=UPI003EBC2B30